MWQGKNADRENGITVGKGGLLGKEKREWKSGEIISSRRHRSSASDEAPERFVMWKVVSCGGGERWGTKLDFGSGKPFHDDHGAAAVGAEPEVVQVGSCCWFWLDRLS